MRTQAEDIRAELLAVKRKLKEVTEENGLLKARVGRAQSVARQKEKVISDLIIRGVDRSGDPHGFLTANLREKNLIQSLTDQVKKLESKLTTANKKLEEEKKATPEVIIHDLQRKNETLQGENDHLRMVVKGLRRMPVASRPLSTSRPASSASSAPKKHSVISVASSTSATGKTATTPRMLRSSSSQELMCEVELRGLEQQIRKLRLENHFLLQEKEHAMVVSRNVSKIID